MNRDTKLRHDVVTALSGIVGARLAGIRLMGPAPTEGTTVSALMGEPFHACRGVELVLEPSPPLQITLERVQELEAWEGAEEWQRDFMLVAKRTRADVQHGQQSLDANDLPVWRGHIGRTIDKIQLLGQRETGPAVVRIEFLDGAVWVGYGSGQPSDPPAMRFGDGDQVLVASERQAQQLSGQPELIVLWDSGS